MSALDWAVLFGTLAAFVAYGVWRGRGERDLTEYLVAGRRMAWPVVALSVMATQAGPVTFLSTPGQGYADGLRFVQFYFGLPLAMVVLCVTAIPRYLGLQVFTAYEYLERRFGAPTRTLAASLFLLQRGLSAGITLYAPALVLSVILGWDVRWTCVLLAVLAVAYTTSGGSKAVSHSHVLQFTIIMATMVVAFALILRSLPSGVGPRDALWLAGHLGKTNALQLRFDPNDRYNLWSGLIGGFFLQLSYFGTDQSQVGRYLTARSVSQSRLGLLTNGLLKIPMQLFILSLGVLMFVFYLFTSPPLHFNPAVRAHLESSPDAAEVRALEARHAQATALRARHVRDLLAARGEPARLAAADQSLSADRASLDQIRDRTTTLIQRDQPGAPTSDTNYVFLSFVLAHLPVGLIGMVFAAVFAASMNSSSSELSALASTTVVDVVGRHSPGTVAGHRGVWVSRIATLAWAAFAVAFAEVCSRLGSLIEAVNILGSLFYGTILGIFLVAFYVPRVGGRAVFVAALIAEAVVIVCFKFSGLSFLWYNLIGAGLVVVVGIAFEPLMGGRK